MVISYACVWIKDITYCEFVNCSQLDNISDSDGLARSPGGSFREERPRLPGRPPARVRVAQIVVFQIPYFGFS